MVFMTKSCSKRTARWTTGWSTAVDRHRSRARGATRRRLGQGGAGPGRDCRPPRPQGFPSKETLFPLHVYFPTEESNRASGGDPRRLRASARPASAGNEPRSDPLQRDPDRGGRGFLRRNRCPGPGRTFSGTRERIRRHSANPATGLGEQCIQRCIEALRGSRFLPGYGRSPQGPGRGSCCSRRGPRPCGRAPPPRPTGDGRVVVAAVESDRNSPAFLRDELEVAEWSLEDALAHLRDPRRAPCGVLRVPCGLVGGASAVRRFAAAIADVRCVRTAAGEWAAPDQTGSSSLGSETTSTSRPIFLSRSSRCPTIDGLNPLLPKPAFASSSGGSSCATTCFRSSPRPTPMPQLRERAMRGLRAYYESQRAGDPILRRRIGEVLLPATSARGSNDLASARKRSTSAKLDRQRTRSNGCMALRGGGVPGNRPALGLRSRARPSTSS